MKEFTDKDVGSDGYIMAWQAGDLGVCNDVIKNKAATKNVIKFNGRIMRVYQKLNNKFNKGFIEWYITSKGKRIYIDT
jgi:hypothetical protein